MSSPGMSGPRLSKSTYLTGKQCHLRLWHDFHASRLAIPVDDTLQLVFDTGHEVGELARRRYPGGHLIAHGHKHVPEALEETRQVIKASAPPALLRPRFSMSMSWSAPMCSSACLTVVGVWWR